MIKPTLTFSSSLMGFLRHVACMRECAHACTRVPTCVSVYGNNSFTSDLHLNMNWTITGLLPWHTCMRVSGVGISWHLTVWFRLWGQTIRFCNHYRSISMQQFFYVHFHAWFSKIYIYIWVCYSEFANHFLLLWWSLKTTDVLTYLILYKGESFVTNMTFYEQCNNQCSLHWLLQVSVLLSF